MVRSVSGRAHCHGRGRAQVRQVLLFALHDRHQIGRQVIDVPQLAGAEDLRMAGQDLLDEGRSGPGDADDEDR